MLSRVELRDWATLLDCEPQRAKQRAHSCAWRPLGSICGAPNMCSAPFSECRLSRTLLIIDS